MTKRALLIGIDRYNNPLRGCINDVKDIANTLVMSGFDFSKIRILTNERATKQNILNELRQLADRTGPADHLIFYFAGYGSRIIQQQTPYDDIFFANEIICPYDIDFATGNYILDYDIRTILSSILANANIEIILDCGFSGTLSSSDSLTENHIHAREGEIKNIRYLTPPLEYDFYAKYAFRLYTQKFLKAPEQHQVIISSTSVLDVALWIACQDNQSCYESKIDDKVRGIFTSYFCKSLRESDARIRRDMLCGIINMHIEYSGFEQRALLQTSREDKAKALTFNGPINPPGT